MYDLNELLLNKVPINMELINKKLQTYDQVFEVTTFLEQVEQKRNMYDEEMKRLTDIYEDFATCKERIAQEFLRR